MENSYAVAVVGAGVAGFFGCLLCKRKPKKDVVDIATLEEDFKAYHAMFTVISQEKAAIIATVEKFITTLPSSGNSEVREHGEQFFSEKSALLITFEREKIKWKELISSFCESIDSYPYFDTSRAKEPGYIRELHKEIGEHHEKVKILAEAFFNGLPDVEYQWQVRV